MLAAMEVGIGRCCFGKQLPWFSSWNSRLSDAEIIHQLRSDVVGCYSERCLLSFGHLHFSSTIKNRRRHGFWRTCTMPVSLVESSLGLSEDYSKDGENASEDSAKKLLTQPLSSNELKSLLVDSEREKLIRKLSEANQQNRFLKRQLHAKEDALVNFKSELAVMELEIQALLTLAEEISQTGIPEGSRKINGKYIQSHLLSRLEALHGKLKEQIKDVDAVQSKEVSLFWCGVAESVQVMGSFDGWSQGEHLSAAYDGSFTKFTTTLMLRPGRYEIKFLVDGEWHLSPEYPTTGEGANENNLLIVDG